MEKSTFSFLIGLMIIVIIIESTALSSTLPVSRVSNITPPPGSSGTGTNTAVFAQQTLIQPTLVSALTTQPTPVSPNSNFSLAPIQKASIPAVQTIAPIQKTQYFTYDDPLPDGGDDYSNPMRAVYVPLPTIPAEEYVEIFHENQAFVYNSTAISFNLVNAPMKISYNVTPRMLTDEKWVINRDAGKKTSDGKIINVTRYDEASWFQLTVFDKNKNGTIVLQDGFGNGYDQNPSKEIVLRNPGNYQLKFEGNFIRVDTLISVPKEGNIPG
jgi:hypothetical protein